MTLRSAAIATMFAGRRCYGGVEEPAWEVSADVAGEPVARSAAQTGADLLDDGHQRVDERHEPAEPVPEPRPCLAVGGDRGRIIVRGAADETGPENLEETRLARSDDRAARGSCRRRSRDIFGYIHFCSAWRSHCVRRAKSSTAAWETSSRRLAHRRAGKKVGRRNLAGPIGCSSRQPQVAASSADRLTSERAIWFSFWSACFSSSSVSSRSCATS
jgi:hypothetical protein